MILDRFIHSFVSYIPKLSLMAKPSNLGQVYKASSMSSSNYNMEIEIEIRG